MNKKEKEAIEIVKEFNRENRYRDGGRINNAIDTVIRMAERTNKIETYCKEKLAFEKRLERQGEEPDEYNRGCFNTCFNILEIIKEDK